MRGAALVLALAMPLTAAAEIVEIKWLDGGFSQKSTVAPKKFLEVCGKLTQQETVQWQFQGSAPSDFNIHYHVGPDVSYPERDCSARRRLRGLAAESGAKRIKQVVPLFVQRIEVGANDGEVFCSVERTKAA